MKLETLFEKYELLADAPNALEKMRELVLQLAIHGRLVSQSLDDEPASELLQRSRAEMARLMAAEKAKQEKPAPPISDDEVFLSLPVGWVWTRLVDAGQFINGLAFKPSDWGNVGRPIIRIQNLSGRNSHYNRTKERVDPSVVVRDGDILVSWSATLDAFVWRGEEGVLNQHIFRVLPAPLVDNRYLYWLLKWVIRRLAESDHAHGLVMSHINRGPFLAHPIPVPPLAEQKRIVAKVDELMALCDELEAQQEERKARRSALVGASLVRFATAPRAANLDVIFHKSYDIPPADLRRCILQLAVQGALVPFNAEELTVGDHLDFQNGYAFKSEWFKPSGIRLCRNANVSHAVLDWREAVFVDDKVAREFERFALNVGDIVLSLDRPLIATGLKAARVTKADLPCLLLQRVTKLVPKHNQLDLSYLLLWLNSSAFVDSIDPGRSNGVPHISTRQLQRLRFALPPLAEQRRIVAKVEQLMTLVDHLEAQLSKADSTGSALMEALVAELTSRN